MLATALVIPSPAANVQPPRRPWLPSHAESARQVLAAAATFSSSTEGTGNSLPALLSAPPTPLRKCHMAPKSTDPRGLAFEVVPDKSLEQVDEVAVEEVPWKEGEEEKVEILQRRIDEIRGMLGGMSDGEISVSAYDTAWVALVEDIGGGRGPQFPSSLRWIIDNQLPDGSWGDADLFAAHDRLINTLACVIALTTWDVCPDQRRSGLMFLRDNMEKLEEEDPEHTPIGFEIVFPSILDMARKLDLDIPYVTPTLHRIYKARSLKLSKIPRGVMQTVPTTLLHSLEGIPELDWNKLLRLRCADGSFLFSPSSTAFALMETKDGKCLEYLEKVVARFNGGVPNVYPVDMFERVWAVDRLERLGISRYFGQEIKRSLDHVHEHWTEHGICWARNTNVRDVDDTAMAFRLLRLHGYHVSADVFEDFHKDGDFFCFSGQSNQAVTGMYNLNRASQVQLPGESILGKARKFTCRYLMRKQKSNQLLDKWIITKDLPGEVEYTLNFPWCASLPRVEARMYLEQYGGKDDVWIGKTLYRMPYVNNDAYLEAAKIDFNRCQAVHQRELQGLARWVERRGLGGLGARQEEVLEAYFLAASSVYEPERSGERLAWARSAVVMEVVRAHLPRDGLDRMAEQAFLEDFRLGRKKTTEKHHLLVGALDHVINLIALEAAGGASMEQQTKFRIYLRRAWDDWLVTLVNGGDNGDWALLLARTLELCAGRFVLEHSLSKGNDDMCGQQCSRLAHLTTSLCGCPHRRRVSNPKKMNHKTSNGVPIESLDGSMRELLQCLLKSSDAVDGNTKRTFLTIAKTFCYAARCPPATLKTHLSMVLFEAVP